MSTRVFAYTSGDVDPALHWTQIKIPPNPTSGTPHEMQAARKERQRVRKIREAMLREASEAQ